MKFFYMAAFAAILAVPLGGCDQSSTNVNRKDGVKDALDNRPNEGVRDAAEDAKDAVTDGAKDTKDGVKDALDARPNEGVRDAAEDATDAAKREAKEIKDAAKGTNK